LIEGSVSANDWVHFVISLLNHDIGYVRGICRADRSGRYAINMAYGTLAPSPGSTDASLTPYHVDRAKLYITKGSNLKIESTPPLSVKISSAQFFLFLPKKISRNRRIFQG
jgi:hypothetical protein